MLTLTLNGNVEPLRQTLSTLYMNITQYSEDEG